MPLVRPGMKVAVMPEARGCTSLELKNVEKLLKHWGLQPVILDDLVPGDKIMPHDSVVRARMVWNLLGQDDIQIYWLLRGEGGAAATLEERNLKCFLKEYTQKNAVYIGFSDATSSHFAYNGIFRSQLHAPNLYDIVKGYVSEESIVALYTTLFGITKPIAEIMPEGMKYRKQKTQEGKLPFDAAKFYTSSEEQITFNGLIPLNKAARQTDKSVNGKVVGGNIITMAVESQKHWNKPGEILFLEQQDLGNSLNNLHRSLINIFSKTNLSTLKAIVFGDLMVNSKIVSAKEIDLCVAECLKEAGKTQGLGIASLDDFPAPILKGLRCGHDYLNLPLPMNSPATITLGASPSMKCSLKCELKAVTKWQDLVRQPGQKELIRSML